MRLFIEETGKIEVKNAGILEVPEGKNVDDLPMSHFEKLANKKGLGKITKALNNLQVWNKKKNPELAKWADNMIDKLNKKLKKDEGIKRHYRSLGEVYKDYKERLLTFDYEPVCEGYIGWKERYLTVDDADQEAAVEEILADAKSYDDRIEWDIDYSGGMFGGQTVFSIYSDGDTFAEAQYAVEQMQDDAIYGRGVYESAIGRRGRYWVTNDDYIPIYGQPDEGYTKMGAVERAQRQAEEAATTFNLGVSETSKWFHIMDSDGNICHELDNAI